ncbi:MAG: hypothetical protein ACRDK7_01145, partial [Solirubrobacteraceae bacterium]
MSTLRGVWWARGALRAIRRQLPKGIDQVHLRPPPQAGRGSQRALSMALRWLGSSCLERAIVRQAFL